LPGSAQIERIFLRYFTINQRVGWCKGATSLVGTNVYAMVYAKAEFKRPLT